MELTKIVQDNINESLKKDEYVIGALISIYNNQTTAHENGIGFNKFDAGILTSMAEQYIQKGYLTPKQINYIRTKMKKYSEQLSRVTVPLLENKRVEKKEKGIEVIPFEQSNPEQSFYGITFPFNEDLIARLKSLPRDERQWNKLYKRWEVRINERNTRKLKEWGLPIPREYMEKFNTGEGNPIKIDSIIGLKKELFPFQKEGIQFIERNNGRALIGDEMGLGKTIQSLGWLQYKGKDVLPAIIIVPSYLKLNWKKEIMESTSFTKVHVISRGFKKDNLPPKDTEIYIINYDIMGDRHRIEGEGTIYEKTSLISKGWMEYFVDIKPRTLICDECHFLKNGKAKRTRATLFLGKYVKNVIGLSGTPITNRPIEFYTIINLIDDKLFPNKLAFGRRYCNARRTRWGWQMTGASNTKELHTILTNSIMIRRLKEEVLPQLPPKRRIHIPFEINNKEEYDKAENSFIDYLSETKGEEKAIKALQAETLVRMEELKQLAVRGKIEACIKWIEDFLDTGQKLVVFGVHSDIINQVQKAFPDVSVKVNKDTPIEKRQEYIERFQNDPNTKLFVAGIRSGGTGLTLTSSSTVAFLEFDWTPGAHDQAEDRVHRIGQELECTIYYLVADGTIEGEMINIIESKRRILGKILDGKEVTDASMFDELLAFYRGGKVRKTTTKKVYTKSIRTKFPVHKKIN